MREKDEPDLFDDQIRAALTGELDRAAPRRDLWPSIRAEVQRRQQKPRKLWLPPFGWATVVIGSVLAIRRAGLAVVSVAASLLLAWLFLSQPWQENIDRHGGDYWYKPESVAKYDGFFQREGVNPLVNTADNVRCSLNVNVATASYIKARSAVQDGRLPDPESVRVEDFINYFAQEYSPPAEDPFAVHIEGGPSPFGGEQPWMVRLGLQGRLLDTQQAQLIARNAKAWIEFNPEVVARYRQLGYEYSRVTSDTSTLTAGEVYSGHTVTALWEVEFRGGSKGRAATAFVKYEDPVTGKPREISRDLDRSEFGTTFELASPSFQLSAVVAEYAEILRQSHWAVGGSLTEVQKEAQRVSALLPADPDVAEFVYLVGRAEQVGNANTMDTIAPQG